MELGTPLFLILLLSLLSACTRTAEVQAATSTTPAPASSLRESVATLAEKIGPRNLADYDRLEETRRYISEQLERSGYTVSNDTFEVEGKAVHNLIAEKKGSDEIVVVGAHYDTVIITPGADDNASGVAVLLELAKRLKEVEIEKTVRFVFFVNEEPPYFHTEEMGSAVYALRCRQANENITGMISLETMGYYSAEPGTHKFPPGISGYPSEGNFLAFIGEPESQAFLDKCLESFEGFPTESLVAPSSVEGVSWSDHASFWSQGYPAIMITDTALFRNPNYHRKSDTADTLDYESLETITQGLVKMIPAL